ncbi:MAG: GAF domain-containing protein [Bacteroidota bacterium]
MKEQEAATAVEKVYIVYPQFEEKIAELKAEGYPVSEHEAERLLALHDLSILDSEDEARFSGIAQIASTVCGTRMSAISLIDLERQWFKAKVGLPVRETPREHSFCQYAIMRDDILEVTDAPSDPRFEDNPLVTGEPNIRFYAGVPLLDVNNRPMGSLCVINDKPMRLSPQQKQALRSLGREVTMMMEVRKRDRLIEQLQDEQAAKD